MYYIVHMGSKITDELCARYYDGWRRGYDADRIYVHVAARYTLSRSTFDSYMPFFFNYTRDRMKTELRGEVFAMEKTPELEDEFVDLVAHGVAYDKAAKIMNIPLPTLMDDWFVNDPIFKNKVDYAREMATIKVVKALHKKATGYNVKTTSKTTTRTGTGDPQSQITNGSVVESVTEREEHISASVEAQKFWLINNSEEWSLEGKQSDQGNKSQILDKIEEMTELTEEDEKELEARKTVTP